MLNCIPSMTVFYLNLWFWRIRLLRLLRLCYFKKSIPGSFHIIIWRQKEPIKSENGKHCSTCSSSTKPYTAKYCTFLKLAFYAKLFKRLHKECTSLCKRLKSESTSTCIVTLKINHDNISSEMTFNYGVVKRCPILP